MSRTLVVATLLVVAAACRQEASPSPAAAAGPPATSSPGAPGVAVARIVFLDKESCCDCTRAAIDASWAALQEALAGRPDLPVERLHLDTQAALAEPYRSRRPMVAVPGIYLLDAAGNVVELLQGEVAAARIRAAMR